MKRKTITIASLFLTSMLLFCACGMLENAEKLNAYDMSGDSIPSINSIVGDRTVEGVSSGTKNGVSTKEYKYASNTVSKDLIAYLTILINDYGYLGITDFNVNNIPGSGQVAAESKDSGKIIIIQLDYTEKGYTISISKGSGTLTTK